MFGSGIRWQKKRTTLQDIEVVSRQCGISHLTARVLINRGIDTCSRINRFLRPCVDDFYDPYELKGMQDAVQRIEKAVREKQSITIYGDYDADGVTSISVLYLFLKELGADVDYYIPDRIDEGYGLNNEAIEKISSRGTKLIITVDCGIRAVEEIRTAACLGMDVIITDHHEPGEVIPECTAVLNPKIDGNTYPFKELAGVGVVCKLMQAIKRDRTYTEYLDIIALGTVADVAPVLDENRIIVKYGLEMMSSTQNLGLAALIEKTGLKGKVINSGHLGYILGPRLNAAGRIGDAAKSVELLTTDDKQEADEIARFLDTENRNRQRIEEDIYASALEMMEKEPELKKKNVIVLASKQWHSGVIGIVASRITNRHNRPCILIALDEEGMGRGSARSISGFNIIEALENCRDLLIKFGGHEQAAGISIIEHNVKSLREELNHIALSKIYGKDLIPHVDYDEEIGLHHLQPGILDELENLAPFGTDNPEPVFMYKGIGVQNIKHVGNNSKHIKFFLKDENMFINGIGFNLGKRYDCIDPGFKLNLLCTIERDTWNGRDKIQLNIKDIKPNYSEEFNEFLIQGFYDYITDGYIDCLTDKVDKHGLSMARKYVKENTGKKLRDKDLLNILSSGERNIILINTLASIQEIMHNIGKECIDGDMVIYYTAPRHDVCEMNSIIINADIRKIDYSVYKNVILYDLCLSTEYMALLLDETKGCAVFPFFQFADLERVQKTTEGLSVGREFLIEFYKAASRIFSSRTSIKTKEFKHLLSARYSIQPNSYMIKSALDIFKELDIIDYTINDLLLRVTGFKNPDKKSLDTSNSYMKLQSLENSVIYMKDYLNNIKK